MSNPLSAMTDDRGGRHAKISNRWLCNTTSRSLMLPIEQGINPGRKPLSDSFSALYIV